METLHEVVRPGIMISQTWPRSRETEGETLKSIEAALRADFFYAVQTVEIPYSRERKEIQTILGREGIPLTYCCARILNENHLNLSGLDKNNRKKSFRRIINVLADAREAGARSVALISGPAPEDQSNRDEALKRLEDSLRHICSEAKSNPPLRIIVEPLDTYAHKKHTLGSTQEGLGICRRLKREGLSNIGLCLDTAHIILNREDPCDALDRAKEYADEFHFCNCVTDPDHPLFGDRHIPFGLPGVMGLNEIGGIMKKAVGIKYFSKEKQHSIFCEVFKREEDDSLEVMRSIIRTLREAWEYAQPH